MTLVSLASFVSRFKKWRLCCAKNFIKKFDTYLSSSSSMFTLMQHSSSWFIKNVILVKKLPTNLIKLCLGHLYELVIVVCSNWAKLDSISCIIAKFWDPRDISLILFYKISPTCLRYVFNWLCSRIFFSLLAINSLLKVLP